MGRWPQEQRKQRICPSYTGSGEDVQHVLFACPLYVLLPMSVVHFFMQRQPAQAVPSYRDAAPAFR